MSERSTRFALGDMARSLGLLLVIVAISLLIGPGRSLILPSSRDKMPAVDYSGYVRGFDAVAGVPAMVPAALPSSWRANGGSLRHAGRLEQLHIGWAVPGERFAGLDEGTGDAAALLRDVIGYAAPAQAAPTTIAGKAWQVGRSKRGEEVFVRAFGPLTVVITGNATGAELRLLASSLHSS